MGRYCLRCEGRRGASSLEYQATQPRRCRSSPHSRSIGQATPPKAGRCASACSAGHGSCRGRDAIPNQTGPLLARGMPRAAAAPRPTLRWRVRLFRFSSPLVRYKGEEKLRDVHHRNERLDQNPQPRACMGAGFSARKFPSLPLWEDGSEGIDRYSVDERSGGRPGAAARGMTRAEGRTFSVEGWSGPAA